MTRVSGLRALGAIATAGIVVALACAAEARETQAAEAPVQLPNPAAADLPALDTILASVRITDPLICALVVARLDQQGTWSRWDRYAMASLDADSATRSLLRHLDRHHSDAASVPRLANALRDANACVRRVAASLIARIEHPAGHTAIRRALAEERAEVREVALLAAGMADATDLGSDLPRHLDDPNSRVRQAAAWALGALEHKAALNALIALLGADRVPEVRQAAAWAVGRIAAS